jgi:CubicO group peptidase (beta-lactamase class C family)
MAEITRRIATLKPAYSFRSGFIYQNIMYSLAGDVVAAASGMSWDDFLRRRIFAPLGMTATETRLSTVTGKPNVAMPHDEVDGTMRLIENRSVDPVAPAGSVWSSVSDMAKWMRFLLDSGRVDGRRLLSEATYRELFTPQVIAPLSMYPTTQLTRPHFFTYGLGWFLHDYQGDAVAMHTGSIAGMSAILGMIPERKQRATGAARCSTCTAASARRRSPRSGSRSSAAWPARARASRWIATRARTSSPPSARWW